MDCSSLRLYYKLYIAHGWASNCPRLANKSMLIVHTGMLEVALKFMGLQRIVQIAVKNIGYGIN